MTRVFGPAGAPGSAPPPPDGVAGGAQAMALSELQADQPLSMRDLAARLKCDPSNITGLIDRLEARGLVERRPHPADRRVKYLVLTPEGRVLRERLSARLCTAPHCVVSLGEAEQRKLHEVLARILEDEIGKR